MTADMGQRYRVKRSYFRFYDVKTGDIGHVREVRYQGSSVYLHMERTGEEHWFRRCDLEPAPLSDQANDRYDEAHPETEHDGGLGSGDWMGPREDR